MKSFHLMYALIVAWPAVLHAESFGFDDDMAGTVPAGWFAGLTGSGSQRWGVAADASAPSQPNVLRQSGIGSFPWIALEHVSVLNGFVETKFKPLTGREDQAGGVVWRFQEGNTYYVARANALEDNVSIYYVEKGSRKTIRYVDAKSFGGQVRAGQWHTLRVEYRGPKHAVFLDGRKAMEVEDRHIAGAGSVGLWTKADSVTVFDDFSYGPIP